MSERGQETRCKGTIDGRRCTKPAYHFGKWCTVDLREPTLYDQIRTLTEERDAARLDLKLAIDQRDEYRSERDALAVCFGEREPDAWAGLSEDGRVLDVNLTKASAYLHKMPRGTIAPLYLRPTDRPTVEDRTP